MKEVEEKCPMCSIPTEKKCDLMVGKGKDNTLVCCCGNLKKTSVKK